MLMRNPCQISSVNATWMVLLLFSLFTFSSTIVHAGSFQKADPNVLKKKTFKKSKGLRILSKPNLEIRLQSGDFEAWGTEKIAEEAFTAIFRIKSAPNISSNWELWKGNVDSGELLTTGSLQANQKLFQINLQGYWPSISPLSAQTYSIRTVLEQGIKSNVVVVKHQANNFAPTIFNHLEPNMLDPMTVFIDLNRLEIIKADEENDEEPYLINIAIVADGRSIDVFDLDDTDVNVLCSTGTHGNLNHGPDVGSGDVLLIPKGPGYFEFKVQPINPELVNLGANAEDLNRSATIALFSMAIEEDGTTTDTANKVKNAMCAEVKRRLDLLIGCTDITSVLTELSESLNGGQANIADVVEDLLPRNWPPTCDAISNCPDIAQFLSCQNPNPICDTLDNDSTLHELLNCNGTPLEEGLKDFAKDIAVGEELDNFATWALPWGLFQASDNDDIIDHALMFFNMEQIRTASRPISINSMLIGSTSGWNEAAVKQVKYRLTGQIGRCRQTFESKRCQPYYAPFMHDGMLHSVYK